MLLQILHSVINNGALTLFSWATCTAVKALVNFPTLAHAKCIYVTFLGVWHWNFTEDVTLENSAHQASSEKSIISTIHDDHFWPTFTSNISRHHLTRGCCVPPKKTFLEVHNTPLSDQVVFPQWESPVKTALHIFEQLCMSYLTLAS